MELAVASRSGNLKGILCTILEGVVAATHGEPVLGVHVVVVHVADL